MDIGMIIIQVQNGRAVIVRCEEDGDGVKLVPALNAQELEARAVRALSVQEVQLDQDGLYLATDNLQSDAAFPPLPLPKDVISYSAARQVLYPERMGEVGWECLRNDIRAGRLRVYRLGVGFETRQYISHAEVARLARQREVETPSDSM